MLRSANPVNNQTITTYEEHTPEETREIIELAAAAQAQWAGSAFSDRRHLMEKAASVLRQHSEQYARMITLEMGKPIKQSVAEVEKCAGVCAYYADHAESFLSNEAVPTGASRSYIAYRPLGVILAVMPWNFPFWQVFRFAAPALMAGNAALLKHASNVTGSALMIASVFIEAGFPEHLFSVLKIPGKKVAQVIEDPHVQAATLTGSVGAGRAVAAKAGESLKKTVLELGGSDPYIILEDANLEQAIRTCANSRLINSGQSCIAAKRFIVAKPLLKAFEEGLVREMASKVMGDPMDRATDVGPQASIDLRDELHTQVMRSIEKGARCLLGGEVPEREGAWYPPSILTNVKPGMPAWDEELFGPVAAITGAADEAEAIRKANDSVFGLGAAVFTSDTSRGQRIAEYGLNAGCCFVNEQVQSDPRLPFGGIGQSGYGRELSEVGIREFTNIKTVYVK